MVLRLLVLFGSLAQNPHSLTTFSPGKGRTQCLATASQHPLRAEGHRGAEAHFYPHQVRGEERGCHRKENCGVTVQLRGGTDREGTLISHSPTRGPVACPHSRSTCCVSPASQHTPRGHGGPCAAGELRGLTRVAHPTSPGFACQTPGLGRLAHGGRGVGLKQVCHEMIPIPSSSPCFPSVHLVPGTAREPRPAVNQMVRNPESPELTSWWRNADHQHSLTYNRNKSNNSINGLHSASFVPGPAIFSVLFCFIFKQTGRVWPS